MSDHDQPEQFDKLEYLRRIIGRVVRGETVTVSPAMARMADYVDQHCLSRELIRQGGRAGADPSRIHIVRFPR